MAWVGKHFKPSYHCISTTNEQAAFKISQKLYSNGCRSYSLHGTPFVFGLMKDVAHLSDNELKRRAIQRIRKRFNEPLDTLTLKWIKDENKKINDWCEKMGYQVHRDT